MSSVCEATLVPGIPRYYICNLSWNKSQSAFQIVPEQMNGAIYFMKIRSSFLILILNYWLSDLNSTRNHPTNNIYIYYNTYIIIYIIIPLIIYILLIYINYICILFNIYWIKTKFINIYTFIFMLFSYSNLRFVSTFKIKCWLCSLGNSKNHTDLWPVSARAERFDNFKCYQVPSTSWPVHKASSFSKRRGFSILPDTCLFWRRKDRYSGATEGVRWTLVQQHWLQQEGLGGPLGQSSVMSNVVTGGLVCNTFLIYKYTMLTGIK